MQVSLHRKYDDSAVVDHHARKRHIARGNCCEYESLGSCPNCHLACLDIRLAFLIP